jgi:hypothetical protein
LALVTLAALALLGFFTGRTVEERALAAQIQSNSRASLSVRPADSTVSMSHQQLAVAEIFALPFADFYEALRSAPGAAREKWIAELAAMTEAPPRKAAISGFYKLLVQFDPKAAVKAISEIQDEGSLRLALGAAVNAAPGFALPLMAELSLSLQDRLKGKRDYVSDVLLDWSLIDPAAAMAFIGDHKKAFDELGHGRYFTTEQVLSSWAAIDPKAAKHWIDEKENEVGSEAREFFIEGWYENDRVAAVSYTLAHAEEPEMSGAIAAVLRSLYFDSKDEAKKFIESLPENKRPEAFHEAFRRLILLDEEATGDAAMTPQDIASWMIEFPAAYWEGALGGLFGNDEKASADLLSWIQQLPAGVREVAAGEYAAPFDKKSPSEKIAPILQVVDPVLRDQLLAATVVNGSLELDEARTAIANAPLSVEQKRHFLEIVAEAKARRDQEEAARMERARAEADQGSEK